MKYKETEKVDSFINYYNSRSPRDFAIFIKKCKEEINKILNMVYYKYIFVKKYIGEDIIKEEIENEILLKISNVELLNKFKLKGNRVDSYNEYWGYLYTISMYVCMSYNGNEYKYYSVKENITKERNDRENDDDKYEECNECDKYNDYIKIKRNGVDCVSKRVKKYNEEELKEMLGDIKNKFNEEEKRDYEMWEDKKINKLSVKEIEKKYGAKNVCVDVCRIGEKIKTRMIKELRFAG